MSKLLFDDVTCVQVLGQRGGDGEAALQERGDAAQDGRLDGGAAGAGPREPDAAGACGGEGVRGTRRCRCVREYGWR